MSASTNASRGRHSGSAVAPRSHGERDSRLARSHRLGRATTTGEPICPGPLILKLAEMETTSPNANDAFTPQQWTNLLASSAQIAAENDRDAVRYDEQGRLTNMTDDQQVFWLGSTYRDKAARSRRWACSVRESIARLAEQRQTA
jgi:hypothetical protein